MDILLKSEIVINRFIQNDIFKDEICLLRAGHSINKTSPLYKCSPYLENNSVMRLRGRIDLANISEETKRPIILPRNHIGTHLIIYKLIIV